MNPIFANIQLTDEVKALCKELRKKLEDDWDVKIAIEGTDPGVGKSCLLIQIVFGVSPDEFDLESSMFYMGASLKESALEIERKFSSLPRYAGFGVDEAEDVLYKLQWYNIVQQTENIRSMKDRKENKASVYAIPRFRDLNEFFRNYRIKYRILVVARGVAIVYKRDNDKDADDPWHTKDSVSIKDKSYRGKPIALRDIDDIIRAESKTPNFWFVMHFNDLPPEVWSEYRKILAVHKEHAHMLVAETIINKREMKWRDGFVGMLNMLKKRNIEITYSEIERELKIPHNTMAQAVDAVQRLRGV